RRDVFFWSNEVEQLGRVTARHAFEFAGRHLLWIADDSALGAAKRHIDHSAFPRHPGGERAYFVERDVRCVADSAFGWPTSEVVLHAIAFEDLYAAGVHFGGNVDLQLAVRNAQDGVQIRIEVEQLCGAIESRHHRLKRVLFFDLADIVKITGGIHCGHWSLSIKTRLRSSSRCENLAGRESHT